MRHGYRRAVLYGLVVTAAFVALDIAITQNAPISGSYSLGAIVAGVLGGLEAAATVAPVAFFFALISGLWNHDFGTAGYFARLFVAFAGALLALGAGRLRDDNEAQLARQQLLGAVADLPRAGDSLDATLVHVVELLVPRYAGFAAVEGGLGGDQRRSASRGTEPIDPASAHETPLQARGRVIGRLRLAAARSGIHDESFMRVLAGRVALALDNAGLSQELMTVEEQMRAILENLGEAVTVQDKSGRLVFANQAAAELLGARSVEDLLATPTEDIVRRFVSVHEDGSPLTADDLPGQAILNGRRPQPLVLRTRDMQTGEERWRLTKSTPVRGPAGDVLLAAHVIEDITDAKRAELSQRLLSEASAVLASSLDYASTLQRVAELAVPALADWCSVSIASGDVLEQVAIAHSDPAMLEFAADYARRWPSHVDDDSGTAQVLRTGEAQLVPEVTPAMLTEAGMPAEQLAAVSQIGIRSVILVPMATAERTVGVLSLVSAESQRRFGEADLELARELGRRAATAIENARLYSQLEHVATTLQSSLLPPDLPDLPGWELRSLYLPAGGETEVGGDFYDVFPTAEGWMAVMGDVVGRGPEAASLTAMARYTLRTAGSLVGTPTLGLARLNDNLRERGDTALCTAAVVLLRDSADDGSIVCAGHPLPLLVRRGHVTPVGRTGPLLGAFEDAEWLPVSCGFQSGDVIVIYTDGVLDARGTDGRFGDERIAATLAGVTSADDAVERIRAALLEFAGAEQDDDTAVLAMQKL